MIPQTIRNFERASLEDVMFNALTNLSDEYFIFHSFRITNVNDGTLNENETDFIIFHPKKGLICLEAKAGHIRYENGEWLYSNGIRMHNGGPYLQAQSNKYKLINYLKDKRYYDIINKCKCLHAVWFPSISDDDLHRIQLPAEADITITMTKSALLEPQKFIDGIFETETTNHIETNLSKTETDRLIKCVLCPQFNVFPASTFDDDLKKIVFHRLLKEQAAILNFLCEQRTAAINGAAGTGKTMVAIEKARRNAAENEKVLFLCYNKELKKYLSENFRNDFIDFYTIDGFACRICNTITPDYDKLSEKLDTYYINGGFPYRHIIIDEGQDFGQESMEDNSIIKSLYEIVTDRGEGTFYIFYDQLQMIQNDKIPEYISNSDCKVTLYRNCRNTENIAKTSLRLITNRNAKMYEGCVKGKLAELIFADDSYEACIDETIKRLKENSVKKEDIVIITCKTIEKSNLNHFVKDGLYKNNVKFTTSRKFKGLESDAVILIDIDANTFINTPLIYYVGASRARLYLSTVVSLSEEECINLLDNLFDYEIRNKNPKRELAKALNSKLV